MLQDEFGERNGIPLLFVEYLAQQAYHETESRLVVIVQNKLNGRTACGDLVDKDPRCVF